LSKIILVGVDGSQPAKKALEYAANLASKNESHLYIVHVIEEFGELIQRWAESYKDRLFKNFLDLACTELYSEIRDVSLKFLVFARRLWNCRDGVIY
jgi:nucleotide-binding universal stress UspA family protein